MERINSYELAFFQFSSRGHRLWYHHPHSEIHREDKVERKFSPVMSSGSLPVQQAFPPPPSQKKQPELGLKSLGPGFLGRPSGETAGRVGTPASCVTLPPLRYASSLVWRRHKWPSVKPSAADQGGDGDSPQSTTAGGARGVEGFQRPTWRRIFSITTPWGGSMKTISLKPHTAPVRRR